jgi:hypothetical protein
MLPRWWNLAIVINTLRNFRVVWLKGRYGGGKTLLSFALAMEMLEMGWFRYLLSNVPSPLSDSFSDVAPYQNRLDCILIYDEAGLYVKNTSQLDEVIAFCRKMNIALIMPSVIPPPLRGRFFSISRAMNFEVFGFPLWLYRCDLNYGGEVDHYYFGLFNPSQYYGLYSTEAYTCDDAGIGKFVLDFGRKQMEVAKYAEGKSGLASPVQIGGASSLDLLASGGSNLLAAADPSSFLGAECSPPAGASEIIPGHFVTYVQSGVAKFAIRPTGQGSWLEWSSDFRGQSVQPVASGGSFEAELFSEAAEAFGESVSILRNYRFPRRS